MAWYDKGMARALQAGIQPSEYKRMAPAQFNAVLQLYEADRSDDMEQWVTFGMELYTRMYQHMTHCTKAIVDTLSAFARAMAR